MKVFACLGMIVLAASPVGVSAQTVQGTGAPAECSAPVAARSLFNGKDLTGWYTFLRGRGKNADPKGVFSVTNGVIRITGEEWGGLVSEEAFSNYLFSVEYRWLGTRHAAKTNAALDSGILFHSVGADGGFGGIWMASHEYNLIQGATGDFWTVHPKGADMCLKAEVSDEKLGGQSFIWKEGGREITITGNGRVCRFDIDRGWTDTPGAPLAVNEKPVGEWNTATLECRGDAVTCWFNGKLVNKATQVKPSGGRIQLQSEGCGVEFRNIVLTPLADACEASRPLFPMDDNAQFQHHWGKGSAVLGTNGLVCQGDTTAFALTERKFSVLRYERQPRKLVLDAELLSGSARVSAAFAYADKDVYETNKTGFTTQEVVLPAGRAKTVLDLSAPLAKAAFATRPRHLAFIPAKGSEPVTLVLHGVDIVEAQTPAEAVDLDVATGTGVHVLRAGTDDRVRLVFANRSSLPGDFEIAMEYESFFGAKRTETFPLRLAPGERREVVSGWRPDQVGHWTVRALIANRNAPADKSVKSRSLAFFKPAGPTEGRAKGFLFSVCTHTERWSPGDRRLEAEAAALCGVKVSRVGGYGWGSLEPQRGAWDWSMADEMFELYGRQGIEIQPILWGSPSWAAQKRLVENKTPDLWKHFPADLNDWREYVRQVARRFRGKIRYYENWNEPDLTGFSAMTLDEYVALQKAFYEEIVKEDAEAVPMTGGFATLTRHHALIYQDFQKDFLRAAKGFFKVHAVHEHGWFKDYQRRIDKLLFPVRKETGTAVPWYSNETAMTSVGGQERKQAETLMKKLLFAWVRGSIGYTWYDLRDDGYDPKYGEHHFGLVSNDFYPKPCYSVYNMLATHYASMTSAEDLSPEADCFLFRFGDGKDLLLPAWCESGSGQTRHFLVETDARAVSVIDLMGQERPVEKRGARVVYAVGHSPCTLKLSGATAARVVGELVHADSGREAVPGRTWTLPLALRNAEAREAVLALSFEALPAGLKAETPSARITLPANGTTNATLAFAVAEAFAAPGEIRLRYAFEGAELSGVVAIPVTPAKVIRGAALNRAPDFTLNRISQVTATTPADPFNSRRLWKNPDDLSARVWLCRDGDALRLRLECTDDLPCAADAKTDAWGDQVRLHFLSGHPAKDNEYALFWPAPTLFADGKPVSEASVEVQRQGVLTTWNIRLPLSVLGLSSDQLAENGLRFNVDAGDDDGDGMDSWLHLGEERPDAENMRKAPLVFF